MYIVYAYACTHSVVYACIYRIYTMQISQDFSQSLDPSYDHLTLTECPVLPTLAAVYVRSDFKKFFLAYKLLHGLAPSYSVYQISLHQIYQHVSSDHKTLANYPPQQTKRKLHGAVLCLTPFLWKSTDVFLILKHSYFEYHLIRIRTA